MIYISTTHKITQWCSIPTFEFDTEVNELGITDHKDFVHICNSFTSTSLLIFYNTLHMHINSRGKNATQKRSKSKANPLAFQLAHKTWKNLAHTYYIKDWLSNISSHILKGIKMFLACHYFAYPFKDCKYHMNSNSRNKWL